jgi:hypothetical protein
MSSAKKRKFSSDRELNSTDESSGSSDHSSLSLGLSNHYKKNVHQKLKNIGRHRDSNVKSPTRKKASGATNRKQSSGKNGTTNNIIITRREVEDLNLNMFLDYASPPQRARPALRRGNHQNTLDSLATLNEPNVSEKKIARANSSKQTQSFPKAYDPSNSSASSSNSSEYRSLNPQRGDTDSETSTTDGFPEDEFYPFLADQGSTFKQQFYDDGTGTHAAHGSTIAFAADLMKQGAVRFTSEMAGSMGNNARDAARCKARVIPWTDRITSQVRKQLQNTELPLVYRRSNVPCDSALEQLNLQQREALKEAIELSLERRDERKALERKLEDQMQTNQLLKEKIQRLKAQGKQSTHPSLMELHAPKQGKKAPGDAFRPAPPGSMNRLFERLFQRP